ncbi:MAG: TadE/TadG family type IV pilus assembly protein [Pseudomonadota bacterium]
MFFVRLKSWIRNERGVALIEFAFIFPFLFLLLFGGVEVVRLMLIHQKLEKTGYVVADIVSQYNPATPGNFAGELKESVLRTDVFPIFNRIMSPYEREDAQAIILTSVKKINGSIKIQWQISGGGTLGDDCTSIVNGATPQQPPDAAVAGTTAAFGAPAAGLLATMPDNENMLVSEVCYRYQPLIQDLLQGVGAAGGNLGFTFFLEPRVYTKRTYFMPRHGELIYLPPTFPVQ